MQPKRVSPANAPALAGGVDKLRQAFAPRLERAGELALLGLDAVEDLIPAFRELRIRAAHDVDHHAARLGQEGALDPHQPAVPNRAAHDAAQDVPRSVVRGSDSFADQERHGARVIGDDLVAETLALDGLGVVTDELAQAAR